MQDEHFMRHWVEGHTRFSGTLDRSLTRLARKVANAVRSGVSIDEAYASCRGHSARLMTVAVLSGIAGGVLVAALATPVPGGAHASEQPGQSRPMRVALA